MASWNIIINREATYQVTLTMSGISDIALATEWRLTMSMPNQAAFLVASTANGLFLPGTSSAQKILVIPAATTTTMPLGNGRYDFDILWAGGVVRRYIANGYLQVNPKAGA
jgi:hypothetical protein